MLDKTRVLCYSRAIEEKIGLLQGEYMSKDREKKKSGYTFLMVSNKDGKVRDISLSMDFVLILSIIIVIAAVGIIVTFIHYTGQMEDERMQILAWEAQYEEAMNLLNASLSENDVLRQEQEKLENQLNRKDYIEQQSSSAEATKYVPTAFPISGQVSTPSKFSEQTEGVTFAVGSGAKIVSSGNGTVSSVTYDTTYGYIVVVNHGNDYLSYYCYSTEPLVAEGDSVSRGQALFFTSDANNTFTYKISYKGTYIDPNTILEVDG